jgi:hypothetical protein
VDDSHSIGEILPSRHFEMIKAATVAIMKAIVLLVTPMTAANPASPPFGVKWR